MTRAGFNCQQIVKPSRSKHETKPSGVGIKPFARLAEIVMVLSAILLVAAIALPGYQRNRNTSREAEVRQNLHAIQLTLERYSTDNDGAYPYFLYGGESNFNIGSINGVNTHYVWRPYASGKIIQPFDSFWHRSQDWGYEDTSWQAIEEGRAEQGYGDVLQSGGYLPRYPRNPFQLGSAGKTFGLDALGTGYADHTCFGGRDGRQMWNNAWFGEAPQLMFYNSPAMEPVRTEYPGSFEYLPRWSDDVTNSGHLRFQIADSKLSTKYRSEMEPPLGMADAANVASLDVEGYDLVALGSERSKGNDLDDSILDANGMHYWRTGYLGLGQSRNPWVTDGLWGGKTQVEDFDARPFSDGIDDFIVIHLGAGMDKKPVDDNDIDTAR